MGVACVIEQLKVNYETVTFMSLFFFFMLRNLFCEVKSDREYQVERLKQYCRRSFKRIPRSNFSGTQRIKIACKPAWTQWDQLRKSIINYRPSQLVLEFLAYTTSHPSPVYTQQSSDWKKVQMWENIHRHICNLSSKINHTIFYAEHIIIYLLYIYIC